MRLAILASGFGDYSVELARALAVRAEVVLFADADALAREGVPAPRDLPVRLFRQDSRLRRWAGLGPLIADLTRSWPDAVLAHEHAHPHLTQFHRAAARIAPLGLIVHDPEPHPGRDARFARTRAGEIAAQRRQASRLFTHGESAGAALGRLCDRPVASFPHGPILRPSRVTTPPGQGRLLIFGRMEAYKGLEVLLEAHRRLSGAGDRVVLELRGDGPELRRLETAFIAAGGCEVARGHASRADLLTALERRDLVLAPYLQASGSGVAAAAMANGRGLVASATGGLAEVVRPGVNGLTAPAGDAEALATAIRTALPRSRALGRRARRLSDDAFGWAHAAETILREMEDAATRRAA